ncbi:MAG TPA: hypothetical protein VGL03_03505 [Thermoanaerobaculia bacterium]|jgi:hypothetical protein
MTSRPPSLRRNSASRRFLAVAGLVFASVLAPNCRPRTTLAVRTEATPAPSADRGPARVEAVGYEFRPAEKKAVEEFLRMNPDLRAASDGDRRKGDDDVESLYGVYHPYFVRGDVNDDGLLDFVLAFVRRDSDPDSPWFSIVVFAGRGDGSFSTGASLERDISLADGDLAIDRDSIVVTPDVSQDAARRYRWDPGKQRHVFVRDAPEEPSSPPPAQT